MSTALAPILQYFFTEHLVSHKQVSPRTIVAYRDSFRPLLQFLKKKTGKQPFTLCGTIWMHLRLSTSWKVWRSSAATKFVLGMLA